MHLFRMYWRRTMRKPGIIYLWLLLPFSFMGIYTLVFGGEGDGMPKTGLAVLDEDDTIVSGLVAGSLETGPLAELLTVHEAADMAAVEKLFEKETASAALVIPKGFTDKLITSERTTLTLYTNPRHYISPQIAEGVLGTLVTMGNGLITLFQEPFDKIKTMAEKEEAPSADDIAETAKMFYAIGQEMPNFEAIMSSDVNIVEAKAEEEADDFNMASLFFPGLVMFALLSLSMSIEFRFMNDRLQKVNNRLIVTPIRPFNLIFQQRLYAAIFLYVMAVVTGLLGGLIWKMPATGLAQANLISLAIVFFIAGVNGTIFNLTNSVKASSAMSSFIMMFLMLFGGGFFPVEFYPEALQGISRMIPTGMANLGLTQSLTGRDLTVSIPVLIVNCLAFFALSIFIGRRRVTQVR